MFRGIANISVDAKGRVAIPKKHRDRLLAEGADDLMVTAGPDRCLLIYPMAVWLPTEQKLLSLPNTNPLNRQMQRLYIGFATESEVDKMGRILVPSKLREYARIDKKTVMVGQGQKLELWSEESWDEKSNAWPDELSEVSFDALSDEAKGLSL